MLWGVADFLGGTAARRIPVTTVVGLSQLVALLGLLPVAALTGELDAERSYLLPAAAAGLVGVLALGAFYRALAIGTMGVVAPITSLGVGVPVIAGFWRGEQPAALELAGIALTVVGVVLAGGPELAGGGRGGLPALLLAGGAAVGFGFVLLLVADASASSVVMTLVSMRAVSVLLMAALLVAALARSRAAWRSGVTRRDVPMIGAIGVSDVTANGAYAVATGSGLVSVTAVLASLYPVVTVLLARRLHAERLRRVQVVGVGVALLGVAMIALG